MSRIVQICGKAPTQAGIPLVVGAERWIIGSAYQDHPVYDRVFDVHPFAYIQEKRPDAWAWYAEQTKPVYLIHKRDEIPASLAYPIELLFRWGQRARQAFSSSVDQMMALALSEGFTTIRLDGVRMNSVEEWHGQRETLAYWIGRAEASGVEVITDPESALCVPETVYGFGEKTGAVRSPGAPVIIYGMPGTVRTQTAFA